MTSCEFNDSTMSELVRSERLSPAVQPHRVPQTQLTTLTATDSVEGIVSLRPGQVVLTTGNLLEENVPTRNRSALILVAVSPVFEQTTGEFFGFNVVELDLRKRLQELLLAVAPEDVTVFITDATGNIVLSYKDGESQHHPGNQSIARRYEQLGSLFEKSPTDTEFNASRQLYGTLVTLGSNQPLETQARIGIVVQLDDTSP